MKINFKCVRFKNFLSSGNVLTEIPLDRNNMTLIIGENGNGKSLIIECITFALFNKPYRNINKPQLVNSINQKDLVVEIEFEIQQNNYKIIRGIKPTIFQIYKNGKMIDQEANDRDYQQFLEENILKMSYKTFVQTVVMGTASFTPFMQLTAQNRRLVVEDLLDLQIFSTMNVIVKSKLNEYKSNIQRLDNEIRVLQEKIKLQENYNKQIESDKSEQIFKIEQTIGSIKEEILKEQTAIDKLLQENSGETLVDVKQQKQKLVEKNDKYKTLEQQLKAKINLICEQIDFFEKNDTCPTCKQEIDSIFKRNIIDEKEPQRKEIDEAIESLVSKQKQITTQCDKIALKLEEIISNNHEIESKNQLIRSKQKEIERLNKQISDLENNNKLTANFAELAIMKSTLNDVTSDYNNLNTEKQEYDIAMLLLKDTGIKSEIIKNYIPIINKFVNKYLEDMNFFVNFELDENFNEVIKSRHRDVFSYNSFSEGEKLRLNLALIFAWREVSKLRSSSTTNILFFDEILDSSLDYDGIDTFFKIVNMLSNDCNVFVISHKTDMIDKFTNIIRVEKKKGFTEWNL